MRGRAPLVALACLTLLTACERKAAFDSALWRAAKVDEGGSVRLQMADSLVAEKRLIGLSRAQVTELLGPPDGDKFTSSDMVYVLGPERGFMSVDYEWLLLTLGKNERVTKAEIVTD
jgi:hypothetical protein